MNPLSLIAQKSSTKLNVLEKLLPLCKFELNSKFISFQSNKEKYQSQSRARLPVTCLKVEFETISFNLVLTIPLRSHCVKSFQTRSFFWSVFSPIWTEYGDLRSKSPYSVQIRENTDQNILRIWALFKQCFTFPLTINPSTIR